MKKIITLLLGITLALTLVGCGNTSQTAIFGGSYFLNNSSNLSVGEVDETNEYSISYVQAESQSNPIITVDSSLSNYKTHLINTVYNETPCYLLETSLQIVGTIKNGEETSNVNDLITTKVYFLGVNENLKPLYSQRNVKAKSIVKLGVNEKNEETFGVYDYDYVLTTTYDGYNSSSQIVVNKKPESDTVFNSKENVKFDNLNKLGAFIDNELMLFAPRAMGLTSSTAKSFITLDVVSNTTHQMTLTSVGEEPTKIIELANYFRNNEKIASGVLTNQVIFSINAQTKGSSTVGFYADFNNKQERACLIKAITQAPYSIGTYTYEIKSATTKN